MGFWSGLGKVLGGIGGAVAAPFTGGASLAWLPAALGAGGAALGAMSGSAANNRGATIEAMLAQDRNRREGAQDQRSSESDALRKLYQTGYLKAGGATPGSGASAYGLPSAGFGPRPASQAQMMGAKTLEMSLLDRLNHPTETTDISKYTKPGIWERIAGIAGPGLTAAGEFANPKAPLPKVPLAIKPKKVPQEYM